jgi:F-type H+-transporting ATPase subunit a
VLLAAEGEGGGFHPPSIVDFFPGPFLFEGTLLEFNRMQLVRLVMAVVLVLLFVLAARRAKVVPGKLQSVAEMALSFVKVNIAEDIIGTEKGRKYANFLTTVFVSILFFNISGIIPGLNIAGTSLIGLPMMLALWVYVMYLGAGIRAHGLGGFLKVSLFPPGVPPFLYVLLTPVEFLTVFILRPATLALRLMANMVAGHLMLVLCFGATHYFFFEAVPAMKAFSALTLVGGLAITLFEVFVAALQAYIFVVLAAVYINLSVSEEH